jgi:hypothetical protein
VGNVDNDGITHNKYKLYSISTKIVFVLYVIIFFYFSWNFIFDSGYHFENWIFVFMFISSIYWIYELIIIKNLSSLNDIERRMKDYTKEIKSSKEGKKEKLDALEKKIATSITTFSSMVGIAFSLLIFLLGFFFVSNKTIGPNVDTVIVSVSSIALIVAGIYSLTGLDMYDTAACPIFNIEEKWNLRLSAKDLFLKSWYFLIFGIITALSFIHVLLTLIGYILYIYIRNTSWNKGIFTSASQM